MGKLYGLAGSSLIGNIFCGVAAYYAVAGYYGWNTPTQPHPSGASAMLANFGHPNLIIVGLFTVGLICSLPGWIALYNSFYPQSAERGKAPRSATANAAATQHPADFTPSGSGVFTPAVTLGPAPQIFVSHIEVGFETLQTEGCIMINIGVVACTNLELEKVAVGGATLKSTALTPDAKAMEIKMVKLDTPSVFQVAGTSAVSPTKEGPTFTIYRGVSTIFLKQYLAPIVHTSVNISLASKKQTLEFDLTGLKLTVLVPEVGNVRLPLWDGVTCRPGIAFSRVVALSASIGPVAPPKLNG